MSAESWDAPEPGWSAAVLNKRYRLTAFLAGSDAATVYRAHDFLLDRSVVLNVLRSRHAGDAHFVRRFRDEATTAAALNHPSIVAVFDIGSDMVDGKPWHYMVTELVDGPTVHQRLREIGRFPVDEAVRILLHVCQGVAYVHKRGLVHGGIRPRHIFLLRDGRARLTDFGLVRITGVEVGPYSAPEASSLTPASDVFSLGALAFEMLSGEPPSATLDASNLSARNPRVSPQLAGIVARALAKDPAQRYRSADHFAAALLEYEQQGEQETLLDARPVRPAPAAAASVKVEPKAAPSVAERVQARQSGAPRRRAGVEPDEAVTLRSPATAATQHEREQSSLGCGVILLAVIAALSVLGLIPLYARVYVEYTRPPAPAAPTSNGGAYIAPTASPVAVLVTDAPPTALPTSTQAAMVDLPADLIGRPLDAALRTWFASSRLAVFGRSEYGLSPAGTILAVEPAAAMVAEGSAVTLTLSTGGVVPIDAQIGGAFMLDSALFTRDEYRPGMSVKFDVTWRALRALGKDYRVFVHLYDAAGNFIAQTGDRSPAHRGVPLPTSAWIVGTVVEDTYELPIPLDAAPGIYEIHVGLYDDAGRLAITGADAERVKNGGVVVNLIRVQ